jgi:hypothetical protein
MKRWEIINSFIEKNGYKDYLEIGIASGICRDSIKVENKTTVDPDTRSNKPDYLMTSDDFFTQNREKFDVVFIDGLHEAPQVYKDIHNALECLKDGGMIFCHDMLPTSEEVQIVPRPIPESVWTGDCWKAWAKLKGMREDLEMFIIQDDWGVGVIKKGSQEIFAELNTSLVNMDWGFYLKHRDKFRYIGADEYRAMV